MNVMYAKQAYFTVNSGISVQSSISHQILIRIKELRINRSLRSTEPVRVKDNLEISTKNHLTSWSRLIICFFALNATKMF